MANPNEDVWNCPKHPSRRPRVGVCFVCLYELLASLCPDCANAHPCACTTLTASSSSSFSSCSSFVSVAGDFPGGTGSVGRVASLIKSEPAFRKSRSIAVQCVESEYPDLGSGRSIHRARSNLLWRLFRGKGGEDGEETEESQRKETKMMRKSRSMVAGDSPENTASKGKTWYFPSPMKAFRQSRVSRMVFHLRSPLYRG